MRVDIECKLLAPLLTSLSDTFISPYSGRSDPEKWLEAIATSQCSILPRHELRPLGANPALFPSRGTTPHPLTPGTWPVATCNSPSAMQTCSPASRDVPPLPLPPRTSRTDLSILRACGARC
jgi:hypothetical protein